MSQPHKYRRSFIHSLFWILFLVIGLCIVSCSPQRGCRQTRNLSGYSWLKNNESGKVIVMDRHGVIACIYKEEPTPIILRHTTDERGYTSVIFRKGIKEYALDFLTPKEWQDFRNKAIE